MDNRHIREEILKYWHVIEFLNQNEFPTIKNKKSIYVSTIGYLMSEQIDIFHKVKQDNFKIKELPETSDKIELCLGKILRDDCVKAIYQLANVSDERNEITRGSIAIMGLQVSTMNHYVPGSFNLSPIVWTIYRMWSQHNSDLTVLINEADYEKDMAEIDSWLLKQETVDMVIIRECYDKVISQFINLALLQPEYTGLFVYQRFKDEKMKERYEETLGYANLHMNFYSKDLSFAMRLNKKDFIHKTEYGKVFIEPYITSALSDEAKDPRIDLLNRSIENKEMLQRVLHIDHAPLGKWPSRYAPAFMQQFAINLAISNNSEFPPFLSVNGPPGTGKTTMLKEVIADAIVKKAMVMSNFPESNDAFTECNFEEGNCINHGYSKFFSHYYKVDRRINQISILVASCNNAAVENITKELPDGEAICNGVKNINDEDENEIKLRQIRHYFDKQDEDIYFTEYANRLFNKSDGDKKIAPHYYWGLISVPLGNRKNQGNFTQILNDFTFEMLGKNDYIEEHKSKYTKAVELFQKQLRVVEQIKIKLKTVCDTERHYQNELANIKEKIKENENILSIQKQQIDTLKTNRKQELCMKKEMLSYLNAEEKEASSKAQLVLDKKQVVSELKDRETVCRDEIMRLESSRSLKETFMAIFRVKTLKSKEISDLYIKLKTIESDITYATSVWEDAEAECHKQRDKCSEMDLLIESQGIKIKSISDEIKKTEKAIDQLNKDIEHENKRLQEIENNLLKWQEKQFRSDQNFDSVTIMNDHFFQQFYAHNSKDVHLLNPWVSERYHREREKLFYYALQVNKEFVLSSTYMRSNLKNLLMMWKGTDGNETIKFKENDKINAFSSLYQTISILVPVISTTFASVGRFLEYVQKPYELGTLIIDEAGQAQPHFALSAMLRCKKVLVVGDPKHVEPVVTDDLDAIKQLLKNEYTTPYSDKHISVQQFSDKLNPFGTYLNDSSGEKLWVGCPLVVHRRCINPMFDISNRISYDGVMIQQTKEPDQNTVDTFAIPISKWLQCSGKEKNHLRKDHYVPEQGKETLHIIKLAFEKAKGDKPDLYVISPFTSVVEGLKKEIRESDFYKLNKEYYNEWMESNIGTVHTFQGKEANEVVLLLGCDQDAKGAVTWVNANIINVAVTRAKYRLCIIGDYKIWKQNQVLKITKGVIDAYTLQYLNQLKEADQTDQNKELITLLMKQLPSSSDYINEKGDGEEDIIDTYILMKELKKIKFARDFLTEQEKKIYHLTDEDLNELSYPVKSHLMTGIKIQSIYEAYAENFNIVFEDDSFKNIMFCKATELYMRESFKIAFDYIDDRKTSKPRTLGNMENMIKININRFIKLTQSEYYNRNWWNDFICKLSNIRELRNDCCHGTSFKHNQEQKLRKLLFDDEVFKNLKVGKKIAENMKKSIK